MAMRPSDIRNKVLARNPGLDLEAKKDLAFQVARHLEEARMAKGYTQKKLADKLGTYQANIARVESGNSLPSLTFLQKMAEAFDTYLIPPRFAFLEKAQSNSFGSIRIMNGFAKDMPVHRNAYRYISSSTAATRDVAFAG